MHAKFETSATQLRDAASEEMARGLRRAGRMVRLPWIAVCGVGALAGCTTPNARLADLPDLRVGVIVDEDLDQDSDDTSRPSHISIGLYYDMTAFRQTIGGCATIEDEISGSVNGNVPLRVESQGDIDEEIDECNVPYLNTPMFVLGIHEMGLVVIDDGSLSITAEFPAPVFGPRMAKPAPVAPATTASWDLVAGQRFAFAWSHPQDLVGVTLDRVTVHMSHGYDYYGVEFEVTEVTDSEIRGVVPALPDYTGPGVVELLISGASATWDPATSCVGAAECNVTSYRLYKHTASLRN
jgi:hypothetical protein